MPAAPRFPDLNFELALWAAGVESVAGLDEAGRGAWAGPVCAAAVVLPPDPAVAARLRGVRDSKQMTPAARAAWAVEIRAAAADWGVGFASAAEIDAGGILPATRLAMRRALAALAAPPAHLLIDALRLPELAAPQTPLIQGDARSLSIAAASVLAKTARDAHLIALDGLYPGYGFGAHKGYGVSAHRAALARLGPAPVHRRSFAPLRALTPPPEATAPFLPGLAAAGLPTGWLAVDVPAFFAAHGRPDLAAHCAAVAAEAARLAERFGLPAGPAAAGGWLHDISGVIPADRRVAAAEAWGLPVLPAEAARPMILHQKLSTVVAQTWFGCFDPAVLSAIGCHTTLKAKPGPLDLLVFLADKLAWDQPGGPPYAAAVQAGLEVSLLAAARAYTAWLLPTLQTPHPWLAEFVGQDFGG